MRGKLFTSNIPGRSTEQTYKPVGKVWPNGEFSLGYVPELEDFDHYRDIYLRGDAQVMPEEQLDEYLQQCGLWEDEVWTSDSLHGLPCSVPLTLSDAYNSHSQPPRAKYGLKGLTAKGRKMIRSGAYLLEQKLGKDDVVMITLTVPTMPLAARQAVAKAWGSLTNRLVQYLSRELLTQGREPAIVGCVEVQSSRLEKTSEAYLHLHLICPAHSNKGRVWAISAKDLRAWWKGALERVAGISLPILPRVETAIVEKSVEAYLSKYLSKGGDECLEAYVADLGEDCIPAQWWFCSATLRAKIRANTMSGHNAGALLESLIEHLLEQGTGEGFEYIRHVDRIVGGKRVTCGWVGRLEPGLRDEIKALLDAARWADVGTVGA